jgi:hypothetical protein
MLLSAGVDADYPGVYLLASRLKAKPGLFNGLVCMVWADPDHFLNGQPMATAEIINKWVGQLSGLAELCLTIYSPLPLRIWKFSRKLTDL